MLKTIKIEVQNTSFDFSYPSEEENMILSVLNGKEYPLDYVTIVRKNPIIIDVGSNCGASVLFFKLNYPDAVISCYEPCLNTFNLLNDNLNQLNNVKTNNCGLWNKKGEFRLNYGLQKLTGSFSLNEWEEDNGGEYVTTKLLSDEINNLEGHKVDLLKIDVEGAEVEIMYELFSNIKSHMIENIFLEYHGEVIKNALIEDFSTMYKVKEIVRGKEQGVLLFFNEHS